MIARKFGSQIQNLVTENSKNHIVLRSNSFSFQNKMKPPPHITRRTSFADSKPPILHQNHSKQTKATAYANQIQLISEVEKEQQLIPKLLKDCLQLMKNEENNKKIIIQQIKMKNPQYINLRAQIIDWVVKIHYNLQLFPQTLFVAVNYIDCFCSKQTIGSSQLYLLAATCIFVAGKYEQSYQTPKITKIQQCSNRELTRQQIIQMQQKILLALDYNLIRTTPIKYLQLFTKISNIGIKNFYLGQYILQLSLIQLSFLQWEASLLGSAVVFLVNKIRKVTPSWPQICKDVIEYEEVQLRTCAKYLCALLERSQEIENAKNIRCKFTKSEFHSAANIRLQKKN